MSNPHVYSAAAGLALALMAGLAGSVTKLDRERVLYPLVLVVIAAFYGLFAVVDARPQVMWSEALLMLPFAGAAFLGFRRNLWLVAAGLFCHGLLDLVHARFVQNAGVPAWWPVFCAAYDATAALYLAWLLASRRPSPARPSAAP